MPRMSKNKEITIISPEFEIGDIVYYNALEDASLPGRILNMHYDMRISNWKYLVVFHPEVDRYCYADELLKKKRIV